MIANAMGADVTDETIPNRPAHLPHGRWLGDFEPLNAAETELVAACSRGDGCKFNNGDRPKVPGVEYTIRAALIRFLVLGGDTAHPVHEKGVQLIGAWIVGELDLEGIKTEADLKLFNCHFDSPLTAQNARLAGLYLSGSLIPGFKADGMVVKGNVFLHKGNFTGAIRLAAAHIGTLVDDVKCWPASGNFLDGLHYDRIAHSTDAATRIDWLKRQHDDHLGEDFKPQPWEQLIKVLREMGHPADAAEVAIAKQKALRKAGKIDGQVRRGLHWIYGALAGFGYKPLRLLYCMTAL